jgi:hypothetical protein
MRLPQAKAGYETRVRYGRYVVGRLRTAGRTENAAAVEAATREMKDAGRGVDDALEPVQTALAARDGLDDGLDDTAQMFRLKLASTSVDAMKKAPYTAIFPKGVDYYTAAPLAEQVSRYKELATRVAQHLATDDALKTATIDAVNGALDSYGAAVTQLDAARTALALARTKRDAAVDAWTTLVERMYGALVADYGKKKADRFFPRASRVDTDDDSAADATAAAE